MELLFDEMMNDERSKLKLLKMQKSVMVMDVFMD